VTRLIINADDFGLTSGVNQSVIELHHRGALTSATLMANASHTSAAVMCAAQSPALGIGCHIVLVDGSPTLPPANLPTLASANGAFRPSLSSFALDLLRGSIPEAEIETEAIAQIRRLQSAGVHVTHLDTHKHTHMFPRVLRPLLRAALLCGVPAIRNPFEPDWALAATRHAPLQRRLQVLLLRTRRSEFLKLTQEAGIATTDGAIGVLATGTLDAASIRTLLGAMPSGTWELVCHPGYIDADLDSMHTRLRQSRAIEHAALAETVPYFLKAHPMVASINFGNLRGENS
jgi:predicted glycoside hydrolase/deacetylase ChbG (UPF0249 family)